MFYEIFKFEIRNRLKKMSTYIYFGMFFFFAFMSVASMGGAFKTFSISVGGGGSGHVYANAPHVLHELVSFLCHFGIIIIAGMMGNAAYRDFEERTYTLYFSYPISKYAYIAGRFIGTLLVLLGVFASIGLGALAAGWMPFVKAEKFADFRLLTYLYPYLVSAIPNLVFTGSIFYTLALRVRKRFPVYVSAIGILMGYLLGLNLASDMSNRFIASLLDPFGNLAMDNMTRYWTVAEKNSLLVPLTGDFLVNRLLWLSIGLLILWLGTRTFSLSHFSAAQERAGKKGGAAALRAEENKTNEKNGTIYSAVSAVTLPLVEKSFSFVYQLKLFFQLLRNEFKMVVKNVYFSVILLMGVIFVFIVGLQNLGRISGTSVFPVTYQVMSLTSGIFVLFIIIILTFYAGELVWRDRDKNFAQIVDATCFRFSDLFLQTGRLDAGAGVDVFRYHRLWNYYPGGQRVLQF